MGPTEVVIFPDGCIVGRCKACGAVVFDHRSTLGTWREIDLGPLFAHCCPIIGPRVRFKLTTLDDPQVLPATRADVERGELRIAYSNAKDGSLTENFFGPMHWEWYEWQYDDPDIMDPRGRVRNPVMEPDGPILMAGGQH